MLIVFVLTATACGDTSDSTTSDTSGTTSTLAVAAPTTAPPTTQAPVTTTTTEASISFDDETCSSSDPSNWAVGTLDIHVANNTSNLVAVVMGTYADGFEHEDLVAYGSDISTRPDFINALEIFEVAPETTSNLLFDHGPGRYFMVCMPETNTMVVLDDLTVP